MPHVLERFIYPTDSRLKIRIPNPSGGNYSTSVGITKIGHEAGLKRALMIVSETGAEMWGEFWHIIIEDTDLLKRLPRSLEPVLSKDTEKNGSERMIYRSMWYEWNNGERTRVCRKVSVDAYGLNDAYRMAKQHILNAYKDLLPFLQYLKDNDHPRYINASLSLPERHDI